LNQLSHRVNESLRLAKTRSGQGFREISTSGLGGFWKRKLAIAREANLKSLPGADFGGDDPLQVHNIRGTGLWMGCMPLKSREIYHRLFD